MDIAKTLKAARMEAGLTQEEVAEKIGVSRQSISNWENSRAYPDIVHVIALSDLYSVSLDALLKGDEKMVEYLEESTNTVKSRQKVRRAVLVGAYLVIWALTILVFWLGGKTDALGYSIVSFYLVLPVTVVILSVLIGKSDGWTNSRWVMVFFFGVMNMLAPYATFSLANMIAFEKINAPDWTGMLSGMLCAGVGMAVGTAVRRFFDRATVHE